MALDRRQIIEHAFLVLNDVGLDGLTLRRLAARLEVKAPAIYWHFRDKRELLDEMATELMRQALMRQKVPGAMEPDAAPWQDWAERTFCTLRSTLLRYRDGAKMFSGTYLTDASLYTAMEANLRQLTDAGFTLRQAVVSIGVLYSFTIGFVIEEQDAQHLIGNRSPTDALAARELRVNKDLNPLAAAAGAEMFTGHDARFKEGLGIILAGMERSLTGTT